MNTPQNRFTNKNNIKKRNSVASYKINYDISHEKVQIVSDDGSIGNIIKKKEAVYIARDKELDLVEISTNNDISICKVIDHGKYLYAIKKKMLQSKKNQKSSIKASTIKEIKLKLNIEIGDYNTKIKQLLSFITKGYKVKITIKLRGREMAIKHKGYELLDRIIDEDSIKNLIKIDSKPESQGNRMYVVLSSK